MQRLPRPHPIWITGAILSLIVGSNGFLSQSAQAQFTSPPGQGKPSGTAGGGSRPGQPFCLQQPARQETLVAISPLKFVGLTHTTPPTVWVHIPRTTAKALEFSLFTDEQKGVYQTNLPVHSSGLLKISFPRDAVTLKPGQSYRWTVALICNPIQRSKDWLVEGWIRYQALPIELQRQLSNATADQRVRLYLQAGYWYEALNSFLTLQQQHPNNANLPVLWTDLIRSAGLQSIAPPLQRTEAIR